MGRACTVRNSLVSDRLRGSGAFVEHKVSANEASRERPAGTRAAGVEGWPRVRVRHPGREVAGDRFAHYGAREGFRHRVGLPPDGGPQEQVRRADKPVGVTEK